MEEILHQLREVGSLSTIIHRVLAPSIPSGWEWDFWSINSNFQVTIYSCRVPKGPAVFKGGGGVTGEP